MLFHLKYIHVLDILVVLEDGPLSSQRGKKIFNIISILLYDKISNYSIYILQCFQGNYKCPIFLIQASKKTLYVTRSHANIYCNVNKKNRYVFHLLWNLSFITILSTMNDYTNNNLFIIVLSFILRYQALHQWCHKFTNLKNVAESQLGFEMVSCGIGCI